jgi:hypothetical protein
MSENTTEHQAPSGSGANVEPTYDLNQLFQLTYGFEALSGLLKQLFGNQKCHEDSIASL